jgi:hypothetical protein
MRKERIETLTDSFVDSNGNTRYFVIAAVSQVFTDTEEPMFVEDSNGDPKWNVTKGLKLGISICNPSDTFNEELGKTIAIGRARKNKQYALLTSQLGYINTILVKAFLTQEAKYIKNNPELYIKGYK